MEPGEAIDERSTWIIVVVDGTNDQVNHVWVTVNVRVEFPGPNLSIGRKLEFTLRTPNGHETLIFDAGVSTGNDFSTTTEHA